MNMMMIVILLFLFSNIQSADFSASSWEFNVDNDPALYDNFRCIDNVDCVLNCYSPYVCHSINVFGPQDAALTINCDSYYYDANPASGGGSCYQMYINANLSSSLTINVYNGDQELYKNDIWVPHNGAGGGYTTTIICGIIGSNSPTTETTYNCGKSTRVFAVEGWNDVAWRYYGANSWALVQQDSSQAMRCGKGIYTAGDMWNYEYLCYGFSVSDPGFLGGAAQYECKTFNECDDYTMPTEEPTKHPTTANPSSSPTAPSAQPTGTPTTAVPSKAPTEVSASPTPSPSYPTASPFTPSPTSARQYKLVPLLSDEQIKWQEADDLCQSKYGTHLATIITSNDFENAFNLMESQDVYDTWIGLNDRYEEGNWKWVDSTACEMDDGRCSQFWSSFPMNSDIFGNNNADCAFMRNTDGNGALVAVDCDGVVALAGDAYLCNSPDIAIEDGTSDVCNAIFMDDIPVIAMDVCVVSNNNGDDIASKLTCNSFGESVIQQWSDSIECNGDPDTQGVFDYGDYVECGGSVCNHAVLTIYDATTCSDSDSYSEKAIIVDNCYQIELNVWAQYECDSETDEILYLKYGNAQCISAPLSTEIYYVDGDCNDQNQYVAVKCAAMRNSLSFGLIVSVFIMTLKLI